MKYVICETVKHYHEVEIDDDELDIQDILNHARENIRRFNTGYEAIENRLEKYKEAYGFPYKVLPNYCGTETVDMEVIDEV